MQGFYVIGKRYSCYYSSKYRLFSSKVNEQIYVLISKANYKSLYFDDNINIIYQQQTHLLSIRLTLSL